MATNANKYDSDKHEDFVQCPRCQAQNAPPESEEFDPTCWECSRHLNIQPVSTGDEVVVDVDDLHERGAGVGHTENGFVVLVESVLPEKRVKAHVTKVRENYAEGELVEVISDEIPDGEVDEGMESVEEDDEGEESDVDEERLGARGDWWG